MTSADVLKCLMSRYCRNGWVCFPELRMGTGFRGENTPDSERSIDLFAMNCYWSKHLQRLAFEIKMSASDFYRELGDPTKRRAALNFSNQFYFVAPAGVIPAKSVPPDSGLMEYKNGNLVRKVPAPWHDSAPNWLFVASVLRRVYTKDRVYFWDVDSIEPRDTDIAPPPSLS